MLICISKIMIKLIPLESSTSKYKKVCFLCVIKLGCEISMQKENSSKDCKTKRKLSFSFILFFSQLFFCSPVPISHVNHWLLRRQICCSRTTDRQESLLSKPTTHMLLCMPTNIYYVNVSCYSSRWLSACPGGALIYQSDIQVPPSTSDIGVFRWQEQPKNRGSFSDRSKIMGSFSDYRL